MLLCQNSSIPTTLQRIQAMHICIKCIRGVSNNSIQCVVCSVCVSYNRCSGVVGSVSYVIDYISCLCNENRTLESRVECSVLLYHVTLVI